MWQHYFQDVAHSPWLTEAAPWIGAARDAWNALSSVLMVGGLFWISQRLKSERRKIGVLVSEFAGELNDKISITTEIAKAARNSAEAAAAATHAHIPPPTTVAHAHWPNLHRDWQRVRERIDLVVMNIQHPELRKKYARFGRDSYHNIIHALSRDGHLPAHAASALLQMNDKVMKLKDRPAQASPTDVANFQSWMLAVDAALPDHPAEARVSDPSMETQTAAE